jgi:hypothetical protein
MNSVPNPSATTGVETDGEVGFSQGDVTPSTPQVPPSPIPMRASSVPHRLIEYTSGYVYSTEMMSHMCLKGHPEQPDRISRIFQAIKDANYITRMKQLAIRPVKRSEALLVHSEDHWDKVLDIQCESLLWIHSIFLAVLSRDCWRTASLAMTTEDIIRSEAYYEHMSLYVMGATTRAARLSCGGVIEACLSVARNELKKTFAIVRPPRSSRRTGRTHGILLLQQCSRGSESCPASDATEKDHDLGLGCPSRWGRYRCSLNNVSQQQEMGRNVHLIMTRPYFIFPYIAMRTAPSTLVAHLAVWSRVEKDAASDSGSVHYKAVVILMEF